MMDTSTDIIVTAKAGISAKRKARGAVLRGLMYFSAALTTILLVAIIGYIFYRGIPHVTWNLLSTVPSLLDDNIGILPNILNTVYIIVIALVFSLPIGVGTAVYLNEYASNKKLVRVIELATETLSGIPSIIYGLAGMLIFVQALNIGTSILAGALTLAVMTLPIIIRTTQEALKTVPDSYREGALALGSGKWHMVRTVVLPCAMDGIVTGIILSIGRIVGESAALLYTAGLANVILNPLQSIKPGNAGATLTVSLYIYAKERGEFGVAFAIAVILLLITFTINIAAKLLAHKLKR
ncbi:MAG: phosphate ABC transporter permease PstA [Lachnospiraceae bacterium]|jgi:phosphate transport system permease protein|nr:phosphate ABC transporter permease PstA [Lachnospiraceae bacterium]MDD7664199.1 phosphate ABC transporter permease PstA [Lachnospiraceae bacterium]MDY4165662.1 phosphate ABC transporter permease PstA [Lachnospiraceae bacterium]